MLIQAALPEALLLASGAGLVSTQGKWDAKWSYLYSATQGWLPAASVIPLPEGPHSGSHSAVSQGACGGWPWFPRSSSGKTLRHMPSTVSRILLQDWAPGTLAAHVPLLASFLPWLMILFPNWSFRGVTASKTMCLESLSQDLLLWAPEPRQYTNTTG